MRDQIRLHHRRGRLGRQCARQPPHRGRFEPGPRAGGGAPRLPLGHPRPHARGSDHADREPLLRLEVRVRAGAVHGRAADLSRPREAARRLEQHQRDDLPARQPARLRAVGVRSRDGGVGLRALPALLQANGDLPSGRRRVPGDRRPARARTWACHESAVRGFLRSSAAGGLRAHKGRERLPPGGFCPLRPQHPPWASPQRRPRLPAPGHVPEQPRGRVRQLRDQDSLRGQAGSRPSSSARRRAARCAAGEIILCGGAFNSPQLLQLSGVGNADELKALGASVVQDLPGVGENLQDHLEVYIQHACTQPVSLAPALKWRNRPWIGLQWLVRRGPGATNHFEGGGFARSNEDVKYPNLMFHFLPIAVRYDGSAPAGGPRLPGPHRSHVLRFQRLGEDQVARSRRSTRRCASTTCRPSRTAGSGQRRSTSPGTSWDRAHSGEFDGGELSPGPGVSTRERDPGLGRDGRRDRTASVLHLQDGDRRPVRRRPGHDEGARPGGTACRRCFRHALRHQRQHLRARHDGRREGGRHHPRQHPSARLRQRPSTATSPTLPPQPPRPISFAVSQEVACVP